MLNSTSSTPTMGNRFIIETANQIWYVADCYGEYPLYLSNTYPMRERHEFADLEQAKEAIRLFWNLRGGAKLKIWQLADDGKRVEVRF